MTLELKKFDMRNVSFKPNENKGPVVVLIGRRDTGKSFLIRDLLFYHCQGYTARDPPETGEVERRRNTASGGIKSLFRIKEGIPRASQATA